MKDNDIKGLSFYCCFGKNGGIRFERVPKLFWRVCIGWIAIGCLHLDIERLLNKGATALNKVKEAGL